MQKKSMNTRQTSKRSNANDMRNARRQNIRATQTTSKIAQFKLPNRIDMPLLIVVLILVAFGIVMVLSASAPSSLAETGKIYSYVKMQGIAAILGLVVMIFLSKVDYKIYKRFYKVIYWFSVLILLAVLTPLGRETAGARRWIYIGVQMQPSEITKIGLIIYLAGYFTDSKNKTDSLWGGCLKPIIAVAIPIFILYKVQNHLSAGIIIGLVSLITIIISGCQLKYLAEMAGFACMGLVGALVIFKDKISGGFRSDRIVAWLHPWEDTSGTSYQTVQGLYAIGSGGLFGVGLGKSKQKYLYIPEAHNDFIFAILAEELGFVGCFLVIALFAILVIRGILIAIRAEDMFGSLLVTGIIAQIAIQVLFNIAVVTNTIPNTGISLPFLSYGGSSLIILLASIGVVLNISRTAKKI